MRSLNPYPPAVLILAGLLCISASGRKQIPGTAPPSNAPREPLTRVLEKLGERVKEYYGNQLRLTCTEVVKQQELNEDLTPKGKPRVFTYDLIITRTEASDNDPSPDFIAIRKLKLQDGKAAKSKSLSKCIAPSSAYIEPLNFLLAENQVDYAFSYMSPDDLQGHGAYVISFTPNRTIPPEMKWKENCFSVSAQNKGKIWVDPTTYNILQLEMQMLEPFEIESPRKRFGSSHTLRYEKAERKIRFHPVIILASKTTLWLPESSESLTVIRGAGVPRFRTTQYFSNYKGFTTEVKVGDDQARTGRH